MKRILIPVDGSQHALHAVQALLEARRYDPVAQVELLNVQVPLQAGKIGRGLTQEEIDAITCANRATLREPAALLHSAGLPCTEHTEIGPIAETIARVARDSRADEIHGLARPGLGIRAADGFGGHQGPASDGPARHPGQVNAQAPQQGASMLNLLVPVDGSDNANRAVLHARAGSRRAVRPRPPAQCPDARALACPA